MPPDTAVTLISNSLHHEWGLPGVLIVVVIGLIQAAYHLISKKSQPVTAHYLRIREVLAGIFRRDFLQEVRQVFRRVEDFFPSFLTRPAGTDDPKSRFEHLIEGLAALNPEDTEKYHKLLVDQLSGVLTYRIDALLSQVEHSDRTHLEERPDHLALVSFSEKTVEDFVLLAQALHRTRTIRDRFFAAQHWARRLLLALIPSFAVVLMSIFVEAPWAQWVGVISAIIFILTGLAVGVAVYLGTGAASWLEDKADHPNAAEAIRSEVMD